MLHRTTVIMNCDLYINFDETRDSTKMKFSSFVVMPAYTVTHHISYRYGKIKLAITDVDLDIKRIREDEFYVIVNKDLMNKFRKPNTDDQINDIIDEIEISKFFYTWHDAFVYGRKHGVTRVDPTHFIEEVSLEN